MDRRTRIRWDRLGPLGADRRLRARPLPLHRARRARWVSTYREAEAQARGGRRSCAPRTAACARARRELSAPGALEREARRLGMVKAGEKAYVIEGLDAAAEPPSLAWRACRTRPRMEQWQAGLRRLAEAPPGAARRRSSA